MRESVGRIPWLGEMVARFEDIDGLPRRVSSGAPSIPLDGASVICFTALDRRHTYTNNCLQRRGDVIQEPASGLAICQYPNESCYYLFSCDADGRVINDSSHQTLEDAKDQAEFEYSGVSRTWQQYA